MPEVDQLGLNSLSDTNVAGLQVAMGEVDVLGEEQSRSRLYEYAELRHGRYCFAVGRDEMVCALVGVVVHDHAFAVVESTLLSEVNVEAGVQCIEPSDVITLTPGQHLEDLVFALDCVVLRSRLNVLSDNYRILQ